MRSRGTADLLLVEKRGERGLDIPVLRIVLRVGSLAIAIHASIFVDSVTVIKNERLEGLDDVVALPSLLRGSGSDKCALLPAKTGSFVLEESKGRLQRRF